MTLRVVGMRKPRHRAAKYLFTVVLMELASSDSKITALTFHVGCLFAKFP